jgi:DNA-binding GntR family transcriptional regulator
VFEKLEPQSLRDRALNALKHAFFSGELRPGDAIVEREVARQMKVGTPVVREALISLQEQGFVQRVANTGTFVTQFNAEQVRQRYALQGELEALAFQWARPRVSAADLQELKGLVDTLVETGKRGESRKFLEQDYSFHRRCWQLSGNFYLAEMLDRLMAPLFAFVVLAGEAPPTTPTGREHYDLIDALGNLQEPEFSGVVRKILTECAFSRLAVGHKRKRIRTDRGAGPASNET